jgi:hypothetical protein
VDENLKATGLVDGGVEEGEETLEKVLKKGIIVVKKRSSVLSAYLVGNIRTSLADITIHLAHDTNVFVAVQQRILLILRPSTARGPVGLQAGIGENDNQALSIPIVRGDGNSLLRNQLRQLGRGARLST